MLQGEFLQSNIWKPGPTSARERNQSREVLVERLDSALGHVAEYRRPDGREGALDEVSRRASEERRDPVEGYRKPLDRRFERGQGYA